MIITQYVKYCNHSDTIDIVYACNNMLHTIFFQVVIELGINQNTVLITSKKCSSFVFVCKLKNYTLLSLGIQLYGK